MKRIVSLLLAFAMLCSLLPQGVLATETPDAAMCNHEHDDSCYAAECTHVHGECGYTEETPCDHDCAQDVACSEKILNCTHVHDDSCGYVVEKEGTDSEATAALDEEIGSGTPDGTPPVLHSLELSATSVTVPGSISFSWSASDDISGISGILLSFFHKESGKYLISDEIPVITEMSGTFSGTITPDQYTLPGEYVLDYIGVSDIAGNVLRYSPNTSVEQEMPEAYKDLKLTVINDVIDQTPPELKSISLLETSMKAPGEIGIAVGAVDAGSGLGHISLGFYCEEADAYIGTGNLAKGYDPKTGLYQGTIEADDYDFPGVYILNHIFLEDKAENYVEYVVDPVASGYGIAIPKELRSLSVEITESVSPDSIAPTIKGVTFSAPTVIVPGTIEMYLDASDDNSGIGLIKGAFYCEKTDKYLDFGESDPEYNKETGKYHMTIKVGQYEPSGVFVLDSLVIQDQADNGIMYDRDSTSNDPIIAELLKDVQFKVINRGADVTTSVSKDTFVDEITNADSDAYIAADYSGDATMPKEAFDAIAGTDKTIDLISEGITWRFEGSDITETTKDIDLKVDIQKVEDDSSASGDAVENELNGNPGVVMKFPENGTLPGKATIQVKVDYAMREYLGSDTGLSVYYYNNQTGELELIASDLKVVNDTYVEFPITHCSYYVLTTGPQEEPMKPEEPTEPTTPAETTPEDSPEPTTPEVPTEPEEVLSGKCGSALSWEFDRSSGVLTISGKGSTISNYTADKAAPWRDFAADITSISFSDSITHIGDYAFAGCTGLTSVVLPGENYVYLGKAAFYGCTNLKEITFISGICYPIYGDTFAGVTANVYFPAGYSWSESSQKQFGENLTWAEYGEDAVMLSFYSAYLKVGETYTSTVEAHPAKATADCTFTADDPSVLRIVSHDQKSVTYKGVKPGRTTVTVTDQNTGLSVSREILVYDSKEISLPYTERVLVDAEPCVRSYTVTPTETAKYVLTMTDINAPGWDSSGFSTSCDGENVPVLNWYWGEGIIRQIVELTAGKTYEIRASSLHPELGMTATIEFRKAGTEMKSIKLSADVVGVEVSEDYLEWIGVMTYPLDSYVDRSNIQWSIKDTSIAEIVDSTEIECGFRAKKAGTTEITVSLNGFTDTATIHVYDTPTIRVGETLELSQFVDTYFQSITFIPEENGRYVFTINSDGLRVPNIGYSSASGEVYYGYGEHYRTLSVKLKAGEVFDVEVYGRSFNGTSTITVNKATDTVKSMNLVCTYNTPDRVEFGVQFTPATAVENVVKWEVSNPNLMGHSRGDGEPHNNVAYYTPYGTGKVTVTAISESGKTASCTLMVGQCLNGHSYSDFSPLLDSFGNSTGEEYRTCYRCDTIEQRHIRPAATSGTCGDNLTWEFDETTGTLTVSGTGSMDNYGIGSMPWVAYQNEIQNVVIEEGATSVGSYAFYDFSNLTQVTIPLSVTTMGDQAFSDSPVETSHYAGAPSQWEVITQNNSGPWNSTVYCAKPGKNLTWSYDEKTAALVVSGSGTMDGFSTPNMPVPWESIKTQIETVKIEEGVTSVGNIAFYDCTALTSVTVPASVTSIALGAFGGSNNLQSITVAEENADYTSVSGVLFNKDKTILIQYPSQKNGGYYSIPDSVTEIAAGAFEKCAKLSSVRIPDGLKAIGHFAFQGSSGLNQIRIPDSVTELGNSAFGSCSNLKLVEIGNGITDLGIHVFDSCTSLEEVILPDTLVNIWENTFAYCTSLKRITLPSGMNFISDGAFHDCTALEEIVIGGLKEFYWSLDNCMALKKVTFQSDAPTHCTNTFQTLTLTAYYPAGNTTWTAAKRASFGGNVTWVPVAYSGICGDNLEWVFDAGTLTISGTGAMYDYTKDQTNPAPWNHLAGDITEVVIEQGVTGVGDYAFYNCDVPVDAFIPQSLTKIGDYSLRGRLYIDQTVRQWYTVEMGTHDAYFPHWNGGATFRNDAPIIASGISGKSVFWELNENGTMEFFGTGDMYEFWATASPYYELPIKAVVIGEGITNIGMNIFEVMETDPLAQTLESVTIASTVKRIETTAFAHCKALKIITFVGDAPSFGSDCFGDVTAMAYYPAGNNSWTDAVMQNYEGDITWVPYCTEHSFGEWITEGNTSSRTCTLCGYTEHKVSTDSGVVEIEIPDQPELDVEVDPVLPSEDSYVLVEKAFEDEDHQEVLKVFDINLKNSEGVHVQPNGTVKVKLPLDWEKDGNYKVYRVNDDGTLTDMNAYRQGSHMVFETDHFSLYVIAEESHTYENGVCTGCGKQDPDAATDVTVIPSTGKIEISCETVGRTVTVTHDVACRVGCLVDGAYVAVPAVANEDGSYSFTVPEGVTEVALVAKGDVNGDGKLNNTDKTRLNAYLLNKNVVLSKANLFASDATGDGKVNNTDKTRMNAVLLEKTTLAW